MEKEILIESDLMSTLELFQNLEADFANDKNVEFILLREQNRNISVSPEVLIALVSFTSATLSAILAGLLNIVGKKAEKRVVVTIEDEDNGKIHMEFASQMNEADILKFVEKAKKLNIRLIKVNKKAN